MQAAGLLQLVEDFKAELVDEVERQAAWHARKAQDNPSDERLRIGAEVLAAVARQLEAIPSDHPKLRAAWRKWYGLKEGVESSNQKLFRAVVLQEFYINYGFKWETSGAEDFLERYVDALDAAETICPK